jgi:phosphoribosylformylglycinamidine synthase
VVKTLHFLGKEDDEVREILKQFNISLTIEEARKVEVMLGRLPTLTEAVIFGIQGSEHSSYKSSKPFLRLLPTEGRHVILGPREDSGIVAITDGPKGKRWGIVVSHESHNHPSQVVPYEGAATGVGGCVRDVLCMGARVIGNLDTLRFGDLQSEETRTVATQVVQGIAGYGNAIGVPNLGGDTVFHHGFNYNCIVNVVSVGLIREDRIIHSFVPKEAGEIGYDIIIVGKPTDRSGFGGAAFASFTLREADREANTGAVQEPNPFLERHIMDSSYALFDWLAANGKLRQVGFKDLGAGGVVCSTVEQIALHGLGADIELNNVHRAIPDLPPEVIACAETQERMCWMCHPELTPHILNHYNEVWDLPSIAEGAQASVIGNVTDDGMYRLRFKGKVVCEARSRHITEGLLYERPTKAWSVKHVEPRPEGVKLEEIFRTMISNPHAASKAPIFRHYDKNIIGATRLECGEADAGLILPLEEVWAYRQNGTKEAEEAKEAGDDRFVGVAVSTDGNPRYGLISPYLQGLNAAVEAMRNVAAVGATPRALTDCLNYGNPEDPEEMWQFAEGVRGIADAAHGVAIDGEPVPVISGNVSFYNTTPQGSIPPSAIVSCIGVMRDGRKAVGQTFKRSNSMLFLLGERKDECGGSAFYEILGALGSNVPQPNFEEVKQQILFITEAIGKGFLLSCHDISDGGLILTLFEMTVPTRKVSTPPGVELNITPSAYRLTPDRILFSETGGFVMEVEEEQEQELLQLATERKLQIFPIGKTTNEATLMVRNGNRELLRLNLPELHRQWAMVLQEKLGL